MSRMSLMNRMNRMNRISRMHRMNDIIHINLIGHVVRSEVVALLDEALLRSWWEIHYCRF